MTTIHGLTLRNAKSIQSPLENVADLLHCRRLFVRCFGLAHRCKGKYGQNSDRYNIFQHDCILQSNGDLWRLCGMSILEEEEERHPAALRPYPVRKRNVGQ